MEDFLKLFFIFILYFFLALTARSTKDCNVLYVNTNESFNAYKIHKIGTDFQIGALQKAKNEIPKLQIHIVLNGTNITKKFHIFISDDYLFIKTIVKKGEMDCGKSAEKLAGNSFIPSWFHLIIRVREDHPTGHLYVSVLRPEDLVPEVTCDSKLDGIIEEEAEFTINSQSTEYIVFNCVAGCPVFENDSLGNKTLTLTFLRPFTITLWKNTKTKSKSSHFKYRLNGKSETIEPVTNSTHFQEIKFGNYSCSINCNYKFTITIIESINTEWGLSACRNKSANKETSWRNGKSLSIPESTSSETEHLGVWEVIGWIGSAIIFCAAIIVVMLLYNRTNVQTSDDDAPGNILPSIMQSDSFETIQHDYNNIKTSVAFRNIRKPEEASEPRSSEIDHLDLVALDHLYPLKVTTDDEISNEDDNMMNSLKSFSTVVTVIKKEDGNDCDKKEC